MSETEETINPDADSDACWRGVEVTLLRKVLDRAAQMADERELPRTSLLMDLTACHVGCPLDFEMLLAFPDFDFVRDIRGIRRHLNRRTGRLGDRFLPRCAKLATAEGARLIAAAPELLEALRSFVDSSLSGNMADALKLQARTAIAKAEGRTV